MSERKTPKKNSNRSASKRKLEKKTLISSGTDFELRSYVKAVVESIYRNGTDNRSTKSGRDEVLIDKLLKTRNIATCGIFALMSKEDQMIIDNKERSTERENPAFLKRFAELVLKCDKIQYDYLNKDFPEEETKTERKKRGVVFVKLTPLGREMITTLRDTGSTSTFKRGFFNIRTIIEDQERQKVLKR